MRWVLIFCCLWIAACGRVEPGADFVFITEAPHNRRDPQKMSYMHDIRLAHNLFETLVNLDFSDMTLEAAGAARWEVSEDGLSYTFHLRPEARWSNGDPVTAHDYIYAWRRAMTPDLATPYADLMFYVRGAKAFFEFRVEQLKAYARNVERGGRPVNRPPPGPEGAGAGESGEGRARLVWELALDEFDRHVGLRAAGDLTLVVELEHPTPYFLQLVAFATFMPVHAASVEANTHFDPNTGQWEVDNAYWHRRDQLITNGPYVLGDVKFRQHTDLLASPTYWNRAASRNRSIRELIVESPNTALLLFERGQADFWPGAPGGQFGETLLKQKHGNVHTVTMAGTYFYNYNCADKLPDGRDNPLKDARVRCALSMAIDREALTRFVTGLGEPAAYSFIPPGALPNYEPPVEAGVRFDPVAARKLLAEAGYPDPSRITGLSILYAPVSIHEDVAQAVAHMWQEHLGVPVALEKLDPKAAAQKQLDRQYVISRSGWFGDYPDPNTWLEMRTTDAPNNTTSWSNVEYDRLIRDSMSELDPRKRMQMLRDAETILLREQPMAMLFHYVFLNLYREDQITGLDSNAWGRWRMEKVKVNRDSNDE
ncbi:MAG: peptide ABC transporter substrate-binding protein [Phycisphaeraceae bacterium]|nr:peptide ABC transporter substrate-binding protein [Phycisphaeraceae bacterium]